MSSWAPERFLKGIFSQFSKIINRFMFKKNNQKWKQLLTWQLFFIFSRFVSGIQNKHSTVLKNTKGLAVSGSWDKQIHKSK